MPRQINQAYTQEWFGNYMDLSLTTTPVNDLTSYRFIKLNPNISYSSVYILPGSIIYNTGGSNNARIGLYQVNPSTYEWIDRVLQFSFTSTVNIYFVVWDPLSKTIIMHEC